MKNLQKMKKLFLSGIAALFLATGTAHARAERIPPPDYSQCTRCRSASDQKFFSCAYHYLMRHKQQDPRWKRTQGMSREQIEQSPDALSLASEARRACGR